MSDRQGRPGEELRVPFEQPIALRFLHLDDFTENLSADVSAGGMFLRSRNPHPVGSIFEFEFRLGDDFRLIEGKAQVVWVRRRPDGDLEPGMGVRFVELDDDSRRVILKTVAGHARRGAPSEPDEPGARAASRAPENGRQRPATAPASAVGPPDPAAPEPVVAQPEPAADAAPAHTVPAAVTPADPALAAPRPAATAPDPQRSAGPGAAAREPADVRRYRRPGRIAWLLAAAALAVTAVLWLRPARRTPEPAPAANESAAPAPAAAPATAAPAPATPRAPLDEAVAALRSWAASWSQQRPDAYLAHYSADFRPVDGSARRRWQEQRRNRILAPGWIEVGIAFVEPELLDERTARVQFVQSYESDSYRDVVRKQIDLRREEGGWKIVREVVTP